MARVILRILLAVGNVVVLSHPYVSLGSHQFLSFDFGGAVAIAGMTAMVLSVTSVKSVVHPALRFGANSHHSNV